MAQLRLIALVAFTACRASEAGPTSGLTPPAGWSALPALATAAADAAKKANVTVDDVEAWGEPARGCYAAWIAIRGAGGTPSEIAEPMLASLATELPGLTTSDVIKPDPKAPDAGVLSLSFARPPYHGMVRAPIAKSGALAVVACFWNVREPVACEAACSQLIGNVK